jgi:hypothetical protein
MPTQTKKSPVTKQQKEQITELQDLKRKKKEIEAREKELKQILKDQLLEKVRAAGGEINLPEIAATLKLAENAPKLVGQNGKELKAETKGRLLHLLQAETNDKYIEQKANAKLILESIEADSVLRELLQREGIEVAQDERLDVK